jgi:hypothetical protein
MAAKPDVTKRRVVMKNVIPAGFNDKGKPVFHIHEATDDVPVDDLDAYVADARTRWQSVKVTRTPKKG